jgi:chromate transport protein ChrA
MKTRQIKRYSTFLAFCISAILFAKLLDEARYVQLLNKIAYGLSLLIFSYAIELMLKLQKKNIQNNYSYQIIIEKLQTT